MLQVRMCCLCYIRKIIFHVLDLGGWVSPLCIIYKLTSTILPYHTVSYTCEHLAWIPIREPPVSIAVQCYSGALYKHLSRGWVRCRHFPSPQCRHIWYHTLHCKQHLWRVTLKWHRMCPLDPFFDPLTGKNEAKSICHQGQCNMTLCILQLFSLTIKNQSLQQIK